MASSHRTPWDKSTHYSIVRSDSPITEDGYKIGEPKFIQCDGCGAKELITPEPTAGVDDLQHSRDCPQRFVRSNWWAMNMADGGDA